VIEYATTNQHSVISFHINFQTGDNNNNTNEPVDLNHSTKNKLQETHLKFEEFAYHNMKKTQI